MLDADVEREAHGGAGGERCGVDSLDTDGVIDVALDAGDAAVVDVDVADDVAREPAEGIGTP